MPRRVPGGVKQSLEPNESQKSDGTFVNMKRRKGSAQGLGVSALAVVFSENGEDSHKMLSHDQIPQPIIGLHQEAALPPPQQRGPRINVNYYEGGKKGEVNVSTKVVQKRFNGKEWRRLCDVEDCWNKSKKCGLCCRRLNSEPIFMPRRIPGVKHNLSTAVEPTESRKSVGTSMPRGYGQKTQPPPYIVTTRVTQATDVTPLLRARATTN